MLHGVDDCSAGLPFMTDGGNVKTMIFQVLRRGGSGDGLSC